MTVLVCTEQRIKTDYAKRSAAILLSFLFERSFFVLKHLKDAVIERIIASDELRFYNNGRYLW